MIKKFSKKIKIRKAKKAEKTLQKALKKEAKILAKKANTAFDKGVISWTAPEYIKHRKGGIWYTIFALIFIGGGFAAYLFDSWTFSVALLVFAVTYLILDKKKPKRVPIILSEIGVKVGNKVYQYSRIRAFWLAYNPPFIKTLNIRVHNEYLVDIEIQLDDQDPGRVYQFLSKKLPELEGKKEAFFEQFMKSLRF